jgi:hypothetical protein
MILVMRPGLSHRKKIKKITKINSQLIKIGKIKLKKKYLEKDEKITLANPDQLEKPIK